MYIQYLWKVKGEKRDFQIINALKFYSYITDNYNCVLCFPGYLSTEGNEDRYIDELDSIFDYGGNKQYIGFFSGMSEARKNKHDIAVKTKAKNLKIIKVKSASKSNHSKQWIFFRIREGELKDDILNKNVPLSADNYEKFLEEIEVNAVLIGSSNQSLNTLFPEGNAGKGEADVFLYRELREYNDENKDKLKNFVKSIIPNVAGNKDYRNVKQLFDDNFFKSTLIAKSLFNGWGYENDELALKEKILKPMLKEHLK